jgi:hypothetical protein
MLGAFEEATNPIESRDKRIKIQDLIIFCPF